MKQVTRVLLQDKNGKILLVKHGKLNPWALPGGHIEQGENMYEAAHREIKEEFNFEIQILGDKDGIDREREELVEYVKPISIYSVDFFSRGSGKQELKLEFIFLGKIVGGELQVQETEIFDYNFFDATEVLSEEYDIYPQIKYLVKKYVK